MLIVLPEQQQPLATLRELRGAVLYLTTKLAIFKATIKSEVRLGSMAFDSKRATIAHPNKVTKRKLDLAIASPNRAMWLQYRHEATNGRPRPVRGVAHRPPPTSPLSPDPSIDSNYSWITSARMRMPLWLEQHGPSSKVRHPRTKQDARRKVSLGPHINPGTARGLLFLC